MKTPLALLALAGISPVAALDITLTPVPDTDPTFGSEVTTHADDPGNLHFDRILRAAADYWERVIPEDHDLEVFYYYSNARLQQNRNSIAHASPIATDPTQGRITQGRVRVTANESSLIDADADGVIDDLFIDLNDPLDWYFDPTPAFHEEFDLQPTLNQSLDAATRTTIFGFNGTFPSALEINYQGTTIPGAPAEAANNFDLYSTLLHELGHLLGMSSGTAPDGSVIYTAAFNEAGTDLSFDPDPSLCNGWSNIGFATRITTNGNIDHSHVACPGCLMNTSGGRGRRRLPTTSDYLALSSAPNPDWLDLDLPRKYFLPNAFISPINPGDWNTAVNWAGNRVPDSFDDAIIRGSGTTAVAVSLSGPGSAENLSVGDDSTLTISGQTLAVDRTTSSIWNGSFLGQPAIILLNAAQLTTSELQLSDQFLSLNGSTLTIHRLGRLDSLVPANADDATRFAQLLGNGTIAMPSIVPGTINATPLFVNNGRIIATGGNLLFTCDADEVWDLDGDMSVDADSFEDGLVDATAGSIQFASGSMAGSFRGEMRVGAGHAFSFARPWTFGENQLGSLFLTGDPVGTVNGDSADLGGAGQVIFGGGTVTTEGLASITAPSHWAPFSSLICEENSRLTLLGDVILDGADIEGPGSLRLSAPVRVASSTSIETDAVRFSSSDDLTLHAGLTLRCDFLNETDSIVPATFRIGHPTLPGAHLRVLEPTTWTLGGELHFGGVSPTALDGTGRMILEGTATIAGTTIWSAPTLNRGQVTVAPGARLELGSGDAITHFMDGGLCDGSGTLVIEPGATLAGSGSISSGFLVNEGTFSAEGGSIDISTGNPVDFDGTSESGILEASGGSFTVFAAPSDPFDGTARIAADSSMAFTMGLDFTASSTLEMSGETSPTTANAVLLTGGSGFAGTADLEGPVRTDFGEIAATASITLVPGTEWELTRACEVASGATITGSATLRTGSSLTLPDLFTLEPTLALEGTLELGGGATEARVTLASLNPDPTAVLSFDLFSPSSHDQLALQGTASLDGTLHLDFHGGGWAPGQSFLLIDAPGLGGAGGASLTHSGLPAGLIPELVPSAAGISVRLAFEGTYAELAALYGASTDAAAAALDSDNDSIPDGLELALDTQHLDPGSFPEMDFDTLIDEETGETFLTFQYLEPNHLSLTDTSLLLERSTDLITWSTEGTSIHDTLLIEDATRRTWRIDGAEPPATRAFGRLRLRIDDPQLVWHLEAAYDEGDLSSPTSLALDTNDLPRVAFIKSGNLGISRFDGAIWTTELIPVAGNLSGEVSLALHPTTGLISVAAYNSTSDDLLFFEDTGSGWLQTTVDSQGDAGRYCSLAFLPDGSPAIAYYDNTEDDLEFATRTDGIWTTTTVDASGNVGHYCSLAVSPDGDPAIAYGDGSFFVELNYATRIDGLWQISSDINRYQYDSLFDISLAFNPLTGHPAIASAERILAGKLVYVAWDGNGWKISDVERLGNNGKGCSLAFDAAGQPAISHQDYQNDDLKYAVLEGEDWEIQVVDGDLSVGNGSSLKFTSSGRAVISYWDLTERSLYLARLAPE